MVRGSAKSRAPSLDPIAHQVIGEPVDFLDAVAGVVVNLETQITEVFERPARAPGETYREGAEAGGGEGPSRPGGVSMFLSNLLNRSYIHCIHSFRAHV